MSRFNDYDGDGDDRWNGGDLWTHRAYLALSGKKGRRALAELREALLALPEKRLIEGALCTVGIRERIAAMPATLSATWGGEAHEYANYERQELEDLVQENVERQGEGVCAIGAYAWWRKVKAGMSPAAAFAAVPIGGGEDETTDAGTEAGLTFTLAWELAYRNDELYVMQTPEERYASFLRFIDCELARPPLTRPVPRPKRAKPDHAEHRRLSGVHTAHLPTEARSMEFGL